MLKHANHNIPKTHEEKQQIIKNAAAAYETYLDALLFDWRNDPNSANTPMRVAKAFVNDIAAGCYSEPPALTAFPNHDGYEGIVCETGIPVKSLCSHHHATFIGVAHIAYIPSKTGKVIGLSKLNRIVEFYSRRPQIQEGLVQGIHSAVDTACEGNLGVAVLIEASHQCVLCRGVKHEGTKMFTSTLTGDFMRDEKTRAEFYKFIEFSKAK